ncbi:PrsW family intramembrane metalloprotease [Marisediminicola sp. LYQ85]|uniref:PrsW family intramembrane metalloprotease n=1 Tax=Marisediminicola sp. LYQ85 TaxID=3391062 RepID=UPI003983209D
MSQSHPFSPVAANPSPVGGGGAEATRPARGADAAVVVAVVALAVLGIVALLVSGYLVLSFGSVAVAIGAVLALVPLALVLWAIRWIDRWEPEPRLALVCALLWGAAAAVAIALVFSFITQIGQALLGVGTSTGTLFLSSVVQAPIVEEIAKGIGVLVLFWVARSRFDGPVDGLVYSSVVAVGFAFTENIQYFAMTLTTGDIVAVTEIFFLRGVLSPFAHVMFSAFIGLALGFASRRTGALGAIGYFGVGLVPAILFHALWNGAAFLVSNFYLYYVLVQVPLFVIAIVAVVAVRRHERRLTAQRLDEYAAAGWFTATEVGYLSSEAGRRAARSWAARHGAGAAYRRFENNATRLAFARQRVITSRDRLAATKAESELLARIVADRTAIAAVPPLPVPAR